MIPLLIFLLLATGCKDPSDRRESALRKKNQTGEYITRKQDQITFIPPMENIPLIPYPWEKTNDSLPRITKEYFRCKGSSLNPVRSEMVRGELMKVHDCGGSSRHSLPLRDGKEWVYPLFIDLLNLIQTKTGKKVVITSGHRCPEHNTYVDPSPLNQYSKHQIGAEVDFYVQDMEFKPEAILQIIFDHYKTHDKKEYSEFARYEKSDVNVSTKPWMNKELFIKLYKSSEGRNSDNRHPYPYISLQLRYDSTKNVRVLYSWDQAFSNFLRH